MSDLSEILVDRLTGTASVNLRIKSASGINLR